MKNRTILVFAAILALQASAAISVAMVSPPANQTTNLTQGNFFNMTVNVTCSGTPCGNVSMVSQHNSSGEIGGGENGPLAISAPTIVNDYAAVTANAFAGAMTIQVDSAAAFSAGNEILVTQVQNASAGVAGAHEFATLLGILGNTLYLTIPLANSYYTSSQNSTSATAAQAVRVPHYTTVNVTATGSIIAKPWDGYTGGVIAFKANSTVTVTGSINATGTGFRGGSGVSGAQTITFAYQGESFTGTGASSNLSNKGGGGGGFNNFEVFSGMSGASGGGGGYSSTGTNGYQSPEGQPGGINGSTYGLPALSLLMLGSGGGGGGTDNNGSIGNGTDGATGGGIIYVSADKVVVTGSVLSNGANSQGSTSTYAGSGGAGAGGSTRLRANNLTIGNRLVNASGGTGGCSASPYCGGNGSTGRIRLDYAALSGSSGQPSGYNGSAPLPPGYVNISNASGNYPFYTTSPQPQYCTLSAGQSCLVTWQVNTTAQVATIYLLRGYAWSTTQSNASTPSTVVVYARPGPRGVATSKSAYTVCGKLYFRISAFGPSGNPVNAPINYKIIDAAAAVQQDRNVTTPGGSYYGTCPLSNPLARGEWTIKAMSAFTRGLGSFIAGAGNAEPWRTDLALDGNKVKYRRGENLAATATVYSMDGLGLESLLAANRLKMFIDSTDVTATASDLGQGSYSFTYNTSSLGGAVHSVRAFANTTAGVQVTTVKSFYLFG